MLLCSSCGQPLDKVSGNARKYCTECAKKRKRAQDKAIYMKRARRERERKRISLQNKRLIDEKNLYSQHAQYLGIPLSYYSIWKKEHKELYNQYMNLHLGPKNEGD